METTRIIRVILGFILGLCRNSVFGLWLAGNEGVGKTIWKLLSCAI